MRVNVQALIDEGLRFLRTGMRVSPVKGKFPWFSQERHGFTWDRFRNEPISPDLLTRYAKDSAATGLCVFTGSHSGGLEIMDFDYKMGRSAYPAFKAQAGSALNGLVWQRSGSGKGFQAAYLCDKPDSGTKIAEIPTGDPKAPYAALIETRGEGNLTVVPPSVHPKSGKLYRYECGHFADAVRISDDQRQTLWALARSFTERVSEPPRQHKPKYALTSYRSVEASTVIEVFNDREDICTWLTRDGYTVRGSYAVRPGGRRNTVKIVDNKSFHNNTSDALFTGSGESGYYHRPFDFFLRIVHNDDFKAAVKDAAQMHGLSIQGWGEAPTPRENILYMPPSPPPPPPPPKNEPESTLVIVTDTKENADILQSYGLDVVVAPRSGSYLGTIQERVDGYTEKVVVFSPPEDGLGDSLAADLGARVVNLPTHLLDFFTDRALAVIEFVALVKSAEYPIYRGTKRIRP